MTEQQIIASAVPPAVDQPLSFAPAVGADAANLSGSLWMGTRPADLGALALTGPTEKSLPSITVPDSAASAVPTFASADVAAAAPQAVPDAAYPSTTDAQLKAADATDDAATDAQYQAQNTSQPLDARWANLSKDPTIDRSQSDKTDGNGHELWERNADDVHNIQVRIGHKAGDPPANYSIDKDGKVHELIPPDKKAMGDNDDTVVIEFDDSAGQAVRDQNAQMRDTALRLIGDIRQSASNAGVSPDIPPELTQMLEGQPVPSPQAVQRGGDRHSSSVPGESNGAPMGSPGTPSFNPGRGHAPRAHNAPRGDAPSSVKPAPSHFNKAVMNSPEVTKAIQSIVHDPKLIPQIQHIMEKVVSKNEGKATTVNWNDNGAGVSVGMFQWNQRRGELPELMRRMAQEQPEAFKAAFGRYADKMTNESFVRSANISPNSELGASMQRAMNDPALQKVQYEMAAEKVAKCATVGKQYGLTSEAGVAVFTDIVNQLGMGSVKSGKGGLPDLARAASGGGGDEAITQHLLQLSSHHAYRGERTHRLASQIRSLDHAHDSMWKGEEVASVPRTDG